jgi:central kinetochore subunit Mal2/MCM21
MKPGQARRGRKQDLRGFVRELRRELVAWHLRSDAVVFLREKLGLVRDSESEADANEDEEEHPWGEKKSPPRNDLGIIGLEATAVEARYVRMEWEDGRLGRFKLSNAGLVERAVFMNDRGRDKQVEDAVTGGGGRVESLFERLKGVSAMKSGSSLS